jgi:hypothetical protein
MALDDKPLVWLSDIVKSPPFSKDARLEAGFLLRKLQKGRQLEMPHSRPMPAVGEVSRVESNRCKCDLAHYL